MRGNRKQREDKRWGPWNRWHPSKGGHEVQVPELPPPTPSVLSVGEALASSPCPALYPNVDPA